MIANLKKTCQNKNYILAFNLTNDQQIIHLEESQYSIGRSPENSIVIKSQSISRFHATILKEVSQEGEVSFFLIDGIPEGERSRNGLFVNGNRCFKHKLEHGDIIQFEPETQANYYVLQKKSEDFVKNLLPRVSAKTNFPSFLPQISNDLAKQTVIVAEQNLSHSPSDLRKFVSLIELSPNPILEIDYQGNIIYANSSAKLHFRDLKQAQINHPILRGYSIIMKV
ncbi:FHA domain-containing protein, partial [Crocosphaera chwakensis]